MSKLVWDNDGERLYETGVDRGVIYPKSALNTYPTGVAWNGLTTVSENPSGAEATALWADNTKYLNLISAEQFGATVEAYMYPDEFMECDGSRELAPGLYAGQQNRKAFGFSYRSLIGNDTEGVDHGYKIHIVYNAMAAPSEVSHSTVNDSPEANTLSWTLSTTPINVTDDQGNPVPGIKPTSHLVIDSTKTDATKLAALEDILYGSASETARLPLPAEVISTLE